MNSAHQSHRSGDLGVRGGSKACASALGPPGTQASRLLGLLLAAALTLAALPGAASAQYQDGGYDCNGGINSVGSMRAYPPEMSTTDLAAVRDDPNAWQYIAWLPQVWRYTEAGWSAAAQPPTWGWNFTFGYSSGVYGNWRRFDNGSEGDIWDFNINVPGWYTVVNSAYWYATRNVPAAFRRYLSHDARAPGVYYCGLGVSAASTTASSPPPPPVIDELPAPPPPPMPTVIPKFDLRITLTDVRGYVREMIRDNTDGRLTHLHGLCSRLSRSTFSCHLSWRIRRHAFVGRARFWHFQKGDTLYWTYLFKGKRTSRCCTLRLRW
jgi:hypothetical protein